MKKLGKVDFEYLSVNELNIEMCRGCTTCITKGEYFCPLKDDDVKLVVEKMDEADGTIFAAPTYVFNTPALMKNLIDRLAYFWHRPRYHNKYAVVISTSCGIGLKEALKCLSFGAAGAWGFKLSGTLGAYTHPPFFDKKLRKKLNIKIETLAGKFYKDLSKTELPSARFGEMMRFRIMSLYSLFFKEIFPANYRFYHENDQLGKDYYLKAAKVNFFKRITAKLLSFFIRILMWKNRKAMDIYRVFLDWSDIGY
jgi:hypothetical protein